MFDSCVASACPSYTSGVTGQTFLSALQYFASLQCLFTEDWPLPATPQDGDCFDFIIVGGGTTGSVIAGRLSEVTNWNILLIEAGPLPPLESLIPYYWFSGMQTGEYSWNYTTTSDDSKSKGFKDRSYNLFRGKLLGGCSSTNAMFYMRGDEHDYNSWYKAGNKDWGWDTVLHYMKKSETLNDLKVDPVTRTYHGSQGPVSIARYNSTDQELIHNLINSYEELGFQVLSDINGATRLGVSHMKGCLYEGKRVSMAKAFLNPVRDRPNLFVMTNTLVTKILIDQRTKTAHGVEVLLGDGSSANFYVKREVIVSAGVINSPQLLMLSGIGPKKHLESFGIEVIQNLPVGRNYRDHLIMPLTVMADRGEAPPLKDTYFEFIKYLYDQTGTLGTLSVPDVVATQAITPGIRYPEFEYAMFNFNNGDTEAVKAFGTAFNYVDSVVDSITQMVAKNQLFVLTPILLHPKSTGYVTLNSTDPKAKPIIFPDFYSNTSDLEMMIKGIRSLLRIIDTRFFKTMKAKLGRIKLNECDDSEFMSDDYFSCLALHLTSTYYHPVGTCKMGPRSDPQTVVNSNLLVHGFQNLRVVDASVMPSTVSGNPMATCMMFGEKAADIIKNTYRARRKRYTRT